MIIDNLISEGSKILKKANIKNPLLDAELLFTSISKKKRIFSIINGKKKIDNKNVNEYFNIIERRKNKEPIAYILNKKEFWGLEFYVDNNVLIPRPDTETLLEDLIKRFKNKSRLNVLDIGTGSGCILLSILNNFKDFKGTGIDKSKKAIKIASYNSTKLKLNNRTKLINCDIDNYKFGKYDIVISNPPYISSQKIKYLSKDVKDFEPLSALDGGLEGLDIIKKVIKVGRKLLKIGGHLYLEIGFDQMDKTRHILIINGYRIVTKLKDYGNNVRCIIGTRIK